MSNHQSASRSNGGFLPCDCACTPAQHPETCKLGHVDRHDLAKQVIEDHRHAQHKHTREPIRYCRFIPLREDSHDFVQRKLRTMLKSATLAPETRLAFGEAISLSTKDADGPKPCRITSSGTTKVPHARSMKCKEATEKNSHRQRARKVWRQFCDKPLPIAAVPQQMALLATLAAEFNFDGVQL